MAFRAKSELSNQDQFLFAWIDETLAKSEGTNCLIVGLNYKNDVEDDRNSIGFKFLERFSPIKRSIINHKKTQSFSNCDIYENLNEFLQKNNSQQTALVIFNVKNASNLLSKNFKTIIDCNSSLSKDDIESIRSKSTRIFKIWKMGFHRMFKFNNILITGGNGFIGRNLVKKIKENHPSLKLQYLI